MLSIFRKIFKTGIVTKDAPSLRPPKKYRGKLTFTAERCTQNNACVDICPVDALHWTIKNNESTLTVDYTACFYCGLCVDICPTKALSQVNETVKGTKDRNDLFKTFTKKRQKEGKSNGEDWQTTDRKN